MCTPTFSLGGAGEGTSPPKTSGAVEPDSPRRPVRDLHLVRQPYPSWFGVGVPVRDSPTGTPRTPPRLDFTSDPPVCPTHPRLPPRPRPGPDPDLNLHHPVHGVTSLPTPRHRLRRSPVQKEAQPSGTQGVYSCDTTRFTSKEGTSPRPDPTHTLDGPSRTLDLPDSVRATPTLSPQSSNKIRRVYWGHTSVPTRGDRTPTTRPPPRPTGSHRLVRPTSPLQATHGDYLPCPMTVQSGEGARGVESV